MRPGAAVAAIAVLACTTLAGAGGAAATAKPTSSSARRAPGHGRDVDARTIRVALLRGAPSASLSATGEWRLYAADGRTLLARGVAGAVWRIERERGGSPRVRAVRPDGVPTVWEQGLVASVVEAGAGARVSLDGTRYRGDLAVLPGDTGLLVVDRVPVDQYLWGVVPLEIGTTRPAADSAAVQAQAVAARSYALTRMTEDSTRPWDLTAGVLDQVYRGVSGERPVGTAAVEATRGLVLTYAGRVVSAPYHSTCGGATAGASEIWRDPGEPFLQSVSDRIPGTDRYYCDISPAFRWTRALDARTLNADLARYLGAYAAVPGGDPGRARALGVASRTTSGRVGSLSVDTDRGRFLVRGNDVRFVLRPPGGEILPSTYFSVETVAAPDGSVAKVTLRGMGNGHGVGMCQWGAIGRARAGQDFRTILRTYFPGTRVELFP